MRILHVLDHSRPFLSGYAIRSESILRSQAGVGLEVKAITSPRHYEPTAKVKLLEQIGDVEYHRCPVLTSSARRFPFLREYLEIKAMGAKIEELSRMWQPDVIHAHSPALSGVAALRVARRRGIPLVYEVRALWEDAAVNQGKLREGDLRYRLRRRLEAHVVRQADQLCVICDGLRKEFLQRGVLASRITVTPNGVDFDRLHEKLGERERNRDEIRRRYALGSARTVGFIGSFYRYEGLDLLIRGMHRIVNEMPDVRALLVGGGEAENELRMLAAELGVDKQIIFAGQVPPEHVRAYYDAMNVVVYPRTSVRLTELTTPLKPLEAIALGIPVLGSNVGGIAELVHNKDELLFQAGDIDDLTAKLRYILCNEAEALDIVDRERALMREVRTWPRIAEVYQQLYRSLTHSAPSASL